MTSRRQVSREVGTYIYTRSTNVDTDTIVAPSLYARAGVGFRLPRGKAVLLSADYEATYGKLAGQDTHTAVLMSVGFGF